MSTPIEDVVRARADLESARRHYQRAVLNANLAGHSVRTISDVLDVTHGTVHNIIKRERNNPPTPTPN